MTAGHSGVVIGLDGGGTSTRALLADVSGASLSEAAGAACTVSSMPIGDALRSAIATIRSAIDNACVSFADVRAICAGVAGVSVEHARLSLEEEIRRFFPDAAVAVVPDYAVAYSGALGGQPGVVVIAGTGSIAYGEDAAGRARRAGGYGYLIDDSGSGFAVGRAALSAVLRAADGSGSPTALCDLVLAAMAVGSVDEIVSSVYGGSVDNTAVAGLARQVSRAAMSGDTVAQEILIAAGEALGELAASVTGPLFGDEPANVAMSGGLWDAGLFIRTSFKRALADRCLAATVCRAQGSPVQGAVQRALRML
jgi:N-acetylglucosamine kinase-like BadF-type ATPase